MLKQHEADVLLRVFNFVNPYLLCYAEKNQDSNCLS